MLGLWVIRDENCRCDCGREKPFFAFVVVPSNTNVKQCVCFIVQFTSFQIFFFFFFFLFFNVLLVFIVIKVIWLCRSWSVRWKGLFVANSPHFFGVWIGNRIINILPYFLLFWPHNGSGWKASLLFLDLGFQDIIGPISLILF